VNPLDQTYVHTFKCIKTVFFSGFGTLLGTIGQANYLAANSLLDRMKFTDKPDNDYTTLMWGGVGGTVGMRYKAFGSMDALNAAPENLLTMQDARNILQMVTLCGHIEWTAGSASDDWSRESMLTLSAGFGSGGGWRPGEDAHIPADITAKQYGFQKPVRKDTGVAKPKTDAAEIKQSPLGGWAFVQSLAKEGSTESLKVEIVEGARVLLTGLELKRKNGMTGIAIKKMSNGRWKVKMDDGSGFALLPDQCLKKCAASMDAIAGFEREADLETQSVAQEQSEPEQQQVEEEAQAVAQEPETQHYEEEAEAAAEKATGVPAEQLKYLTVEGLLHLARPDWNSFAVHLTARALSKIGIFSLPMLKTMLEADECDNGDLNTKLAAAGETCLSDETLHELHKQCASM
jgi:hypothetical protein